MYVLHTEWIAWSWVEGTPLVHSASAHPTSAGGISGRFVSSSTEVSIPLRQTCFWQFCTFGALGVGMPSGRCAVKSHWPIPVLQVGTRQGFEVLQSADVVQLTTHLPKRHAPACPLLVHAVPSATGTTSGVPMVHEPTLHASGAFGALFGSSTEAGWPVAHVIRLQLPGT
jgi:hypothetical protein